MAVSVKTRPLTRDKIASFLKSLELIKAFENITEDVGSTLPAAIDANAAGISSAIAAANAAQATANTAAADAAAARFPAGTRMLFQQTNAPTGWTKDGTHNDKALRVVSGAAGSGGTAAFSTVMTSRTPGGTVGDTALTIAQLPAHTHDTTLPAGGPAGGVVAFFGSTGAGSGTATTTTVGSGATHTHSFAGTAMDFAVQYVDLIIATKD